MWQKTHPWVRRIFNNWQVFKELQMKTIAQSKKNCYNTWPKIFLVGIKWDVKALQTGFYEWWRFLATFIERCRFVMISTFEHSNHFTHFFEIHECISISKYTPFCLSIKLFCVVDSEQASTLESLENTSVEKKEKEGKSWPLHRTSTSSRAAKAELEEKKSVRNAHNLSAKSAR